MKRSSEVLAAGLCWASVLGGAAHAQVAVPIVNPGFEANFAADGTFPVMVPQGWQLVDPLGAIDQAIDAVGVINPTGTTFFTGGVPEGRNAALIFLADPASTPVGLRQVLTTSLLARTRYELRVEVGNIASGTALPPFDVFGFFDLDGFPGYAVQLWAGGQLLAEDHDTLVIPEGTFATSTVRFTTGALPSGPDRPLEIRLINLDRVGTPAEPGIEVDFDAVSLTANPACAADHNRDGAATVQDIFDFLADYFANNPDADINGGGLSVQDVFDFLAAYFGGCG